MRRSLLAVLVGVMLAASAQAGPPESPEVDPAPATGWWKAVAASGPVEVRPDQVREDWNPVRRGDRLDPLSLVRTGRRGRATLTRSGTVLMVDPDSQVELPPLAGDPGSVVQATGSVIYEVDRREGRDFRVVTPYLVAGVKGTIFMVTVTESFASVTVEEGLVEVTSLATGESLDVGAGESVWLDAAADAGMEHVSLRAKSDREADETSPQARKLARADFRRLAHAVAQRDEILMAEPEPGTGNHDPGSNESDLDEGDDRHRNAFEEELDPREGGPSDDELSEDLVNSQARTTEVTQTPVQP